MTMKLYTPLPKYIKDMTSEELTAAFPSSCKQSHLMRSIIMNEKQFSPVNYDRTLRGMWYSVVKPTLDKLGLLTEKDNTEEALTRWDAELSRYTADLVRRGLLTYKDLHIVDQSRQRSNPSNSYSIVDLKTYGYQVGVSAYPNIIISTEKDTVYSIIKNLANLFGCSCISGKGQNSLGAMEDLLRNMGSNYDDIYILTLTDYDPSGYYIADTFKNQVEDLKSALGITAVVHIERIGITPDQLTTVEVEQNKYTPKPTNLDKWLNVTGGINGEPKGLELDALAPDRIRQIFVTSIRKYIDPDVYKKIIKSSYIRRVALEALGPSLDCIITGIVQELENSVEVLDFDITDLALRGYNSLPIRKLCDGSNDDIIKDKALSYLVN
ncbi:hypothetical protein SPSYN_03027 [Sporotomaculum syntrophicum]|uniref:Topoisomerase 6 subunit A/Spo11 TOPRIM domain-containing protein n=2 Tax=Sporotomaculum syntrophicum TaxID=182264 RepID=A0A9D2WN86_9FIRM|nr:hypothetical protein SPSYN_03027 [Sporotomaculum syntrophicum]